MPETHPSQSDHMVHRFAWFRSAVLGANDGIVSISSLTVGVAAAASDKADVTIAAVAGLVAGAISMAAGSMSRSRRRPMPNAPTSRGRNERSKPIRNASSTSLRRST